MFQIFFLVYTLAWFDARMHACMSCHKKLENLTKRVILGGTKEIQKTFMSYKMRSRSRELTEQEKIFCQMYKFIAHEFMPKWKQHRVKTIEEVAYTQLSNAPMRPSERVQKEEERIKRWREPRKCKWCGEGFPKRGGINVVKSRMEHLRLFHRMEGITLANYADHFD